MVKMCSICEETCDKCEKPDWHGMLSGNQGNPHAMAVRQEILFGKWEEESRLDLEKGREVHHFDFKWQGEMMQPSEARATWRAHGKAMAQKLAAARDEKIGNQKCQICMVARSACDWPEVHFSFEDDWVTLCNEIRYVMHQERCKADQANGRASEIFTMGTRLAEHDVDSRERALQDGLKYAQRDAAAYEARCLLEPEKEKERKAAAAKSAAHAEAQKLIAAEAVHKRIESGDLVEAKFYKPELNSWAPVDENTQPWHFWKWSVACESWGGKLWVEKKQVFEAGVWALEPAPGGGFQWKEHAPNPAQTVADAETRPEKRALESGPGGGFQSKEHAPSPAQTVADAEARPEKKAKLQK